MTLLPSLDGPPPSLPRLLDAASERWWGLSPRRRTVLTCLAAALLVVGVLGQSVPVAGPDPVEVAVAVRDLPPGHELSRADLRARHLPAELVPDGALGLDAAGSLTGPLPQGAVLTDAHVGTGGLSALVDGDRAAVALPADLLAEPRVGMVLDLVAIDGPATGHQTTELAASTRVLAVGADHVWVEVEAARAGAVAAAAARRAVAVVVR